MIVDEFGKIGGARSSRRRNRGDVESRAMPIAWLNYEGSSRVLFPKEERSSMVGSCGECWEEGGEVDAKFPFMAERIGRGAGPRKNRRSFLPSREESSR
ncbi:hypothetical protein KM043_002554 [Ampulex compressa]|nr:hypothetical protein KM043_002554 [Ampulex compressa]